MARVSPSCFFIASALLLCGLSSTALNVHRNVGSSPTPAKVTVVFRFFSGRPNPKWETTNRAAVELGKSLTNAKWLDTDDEESMARCLEIEMPGEAFSICGGNAYKEDGNDLKVAKGITVDEAKIKEIASTVPTTALKAAFLSKNNFDGRVSSLSGGDSADVSAQSRLERSSLPSLQSRQNTVKTRIQDSETRMEQVTGLTSDKLDTLSQNSNKHSQIRDALLQLNVTRGQMPSSSQSSFLQEQVEQPPNFDHTWSDDDNCLNYAADIKLGDFGVPGCHGKTKDKVFDHLACLFDTGGTCSLGTAFVDWPIGIQVIEELMTADGFIGPFSFKTAKAFSVLQGCHVVASYLAPPTQHGKEYEDYHWIRKDANTWSHKGGPLPPVTLGSTAPPTIDIPAGFVAHDSGPEFSSYISAGPKYIKTGYWAFCDWIGDIGNCP